MANIYSFYPYYKLSKTHKDAFAIIVFTQHFVNMIRNNISGLHWGCCYTRYTIEHSTIPTNKHVISDYFIIPSIL